MRIKGWHKFQHFKDRRPPWIKLYRDLLDDLEWHDLDPVCAKALVMLWLIASEADGELPPVKKLAFRLRTTEKQINSMISNLSHWLEHDDINAISTQYQSDAPETETETETETTLSGKPDLAEGKNGHDYIAQAKDILDYLNRNSGHAYRPVDTNLKLIVARLKSGATPLQCREVVHAKCQQWGRDAKMAEFLRPATLFNATKFEQYLGEIRG